MPLFLGASASAPEVISFIFKTASLILSLEDLRSYDNFCCGGVDECKFFS